MEIEESPKKAIETPVKSKSELRAERRKIQEEQRAAKAQKMVEAQKGLAKKGGDKPEKKPTQQPKPTNNKVQSIPLVQECVQKVSSQGEAADPPPRERHVSISGLAQQQALRVPSNQRMDDPAQQKKMVRNLNRTQISQLRPFFTSIPPSLQHLPCYDTSACTLSQSLKLGSTASIKSDFIAYGHRLERPQDLIHNSYEYIWFQLYCFSAIIQKYRQPEKEYFGRDFLHYLTRHVDFLNYCKPLPVQMRCLVDVLKQKVSTFKPDMSEKKCKEELLEEVQMFHQTRIHDPLKTIADELSKHVPYGSHLLVMGGPGAWILSHSLVQLHKQLSATPKDIIKGADHKLSHQLPLTITVVDGAPLYVGRQLIAMLQESITQQKLSPLRIQYALFTHLPTVLPQVDKVVLSAHSLLSNSNVLSTVGAAGVAQMAKHFHKPLIIVMETCNFWDRKQADAFEFNHLIDPRLVLWPTANSTKRSGGEKEMRAARNLLEAIDPRMTSKEERKNSSTSDDPGIPGSSIKIYNMELDLIGKECITCIVNDFGSVLPACGSVLHRFKPGAEDTQEA